MSTDAEKQHLSKIVDQFSRQAIPFAELNIHMDAMDLLVEMSGVNGNDTVLDIACGPGLVVCEFAKHASSVTGIDITKAMIGKARDLQNKNKLGNVGLVTGSAYSLPFDDGAFTLVLTRYSFHHFLEPAKALGEMIRVCRPGGLVMVADVCVRDEHSEAYDSMERMRDESHVHALKESEFTLLFGRSGLCYLRRSNYGLDTEVEPLLNASSHTHRDREKILDMIVSDIGINNLGINARHVKGKLMFTFPIAVFTGVKKPE